MKTLASLRSCALAGALLCSAPLGRAQLLTNSTLYPFDADVSYGAGVDLYTNFGLTQTFSSISAITDLSFRFLASNTASFGSTDLTVHFSEWSGTNSTGTLLGSNTINIADSAAWSVGSASINYFDGSLDLASIASSLSPAITYGLTIVGNAVSSGNYRLGTTTGPDFTPGGSFLHISAPVFPALTFAGGGPGNDFLFFGAVTPVPEASTVAVLFAGVFVGGMMLRRTIQKRRQVAAPVGS